VDTDVPVSAAKTHDICLDASMLLAYKQGTPPPDYPAATALPFSVFLLLPSIISVLYSHANSSSRLPHYHAAWDQLCTVRLSVFFVFFIQCAFLLFVFEAAASHGFMIYLIFTN